MEGVQTKKTHTHTHTNPSQSSLTHSSEKNVSPLLLVFSSPGSRERDTEREREREREEEAQVQSEPLDQEVTSYLNQQTHLLPPIFFALLCFDLLYFASLNVSYSMHFSFAAFAKWVICCLHFTSLPTPTNWLKLSSTSSFLLPWWIATNSVAAAHFIIERCLHRFFHLWSNSGTVASFDLLMGLVADLMICCCLGRSFCIQIWVILFPLSFLSLSLQILPLSPSLFKFFLSLSLSSSPINAWMDIHTII